MSLTSAGRLPALGAITALSLGVSACGTLDNPTAPHAQVTLHVADVAMSSGAPEMALRVADLVLAKQPNNAVALRARGDALYAMGQVEPAAQAYRAAVRLDPKLPEAQIGLGRTLIRTDPQAAEAAFLAAATIQPDNVVALSNLGVARDMQKRHVAAQQAYRAALALSPDMADVRVNLGLSLALSGQADEAVQMLRPLASAPGATQLLHADLAVALAQAGDLAGAHRALAVPTEGAPAPQIVAAVPSDAPVAVPAPRVAVTQRDMPQPGRSAAAMPQMAEALRIPRPPVGSQTGILPNPLLAAMITAAPEAEPVPSNATPAVVDPAVVRASSAASGAPAVPVAVTDRVAPSAPVGTPALVIGQADHPQISPVSASAARPVAPMQAAAVRADPPAALEPSPMVVASADLAAPVPAVGRSVPAQAAASDALPPMLPAHDAVPAAPAIARTAIAATAAPAPAAVHGVAAAAVGSDPQASAPSTRAVASDPPATTPPGRTPWLQLAAVTSENDVQVEWHRLQAHLPDLLGGRSLTVSTGEANDRTYWRLRTGGFASLADANALCMRIRLVGGKCLAVMSSGT